MNDEPTFSTRPDLDGDGRVMLVKVGKSALPTDDPQDLYEAARKWWRASLAQAQQARRVLAVVEGTIRAAWEPVRWETVTDADARPRIAFHGRPADDARLLVGRDVRHLYPRGASNPVRYTTVAALEAPKPIADDAVEDSTLLLLRINQTWYDGIPAAELFEATRGFWVMSATKAEQVVRVLAVAQGVVREAYDPTAWLPSPVPGEEHRIGFDGDVAGDRDAWVGMDVSTVFTPGSQNPVRYVTRTDLLGPPIAPATAVEIPALVEPPTGARGTEPDLAERINPLLDALESDLMWSMSRAAQELFHSNTLASLMTNHPFGMMPLRALFEGPEPTGRLEVWREWKHIDLVADGTVGRGRFVVENKLYSVPYREQLERYAEVALPWSKGHGPGGAPGTSYFLLTLMDPNFDLPRPWRRISYEEVLSALEVIDLQDLGADAGMFERYRTLVRRLLGLKEAVDPRQDLDEPFSVKATLGQLHHKGFVGPLQRMRFTGLAQAVSEEYGAPLSLRVDLSHASGSVTFERKLSDDRGLGWQMQEGQLRLFVLVKDRGLAGTGDAKAAARAEVAQREYADFVDFDVAADVLGKRLRPDGLAPGDWRRFAPDFVYRYRKVDERTTTRDLAVALAALTAHVESWFPLG